MCSIWVRQGYQATILVLLSLNLQNGNIRLGRYPSIFPLIKIPNSKFLRQRAAVTAAQPYAALRLEDGRLLSVYRPLKSPPLARNAQ